MRPEVWQSILDRSSSVANSCFVELMQNIAEPFVSAIREFQGSKSVFHGGRLLLVGDAFSLCRPHGGGSTSQAALQAQSLAKVWNGDMSLESWEDMCLESAATAAEFSLKMGQIFWHGLPASAANDAVKLTGP